MLFPDHLHAQRRENTVDLMLIFRDYLHYVRKKKNCAPKWIFLIFGSLAHQMFQGLHSSTHAFACRIAVASKKWRKKKLFARISFLAHSVSLGSEPCQTNQSFGREEDEDHRRQDVCAQISSRAIKKRRHSLFRKTKHFSRFLWHWIDSLEFDVLGNRGFFKKLKKNSCLWAPLLAV